MGWTVSSERVVHERPPWLRVREQDVILPNGDELRDYVLLDERDGCLVLAVTSDGRAILLEQYRHGRGEREIGLPSGFLDGSEDPLNAARRELLEETGYAGDDWTHLGSLFTNSNRGRRLFHFYLAHGVEVAAPPTLESGEADIDAHLVPLRDLREWVAERNGDIGMAAMAGLLMGMAALEREGNR
jgi:8-oxo-dGTP pyrophosphatase MutT (NUDIX family)